MLKFSPASEQILAPVWSADQGYSLTLDKLDRKSQHKKLSHAPRAAQTQQLCNCCKDYCLASSRPRGLISRTGKKD